MTLGGYENRQWVPPGSFGDKNKNIGHGHVFRSSDAGETFVDMADIMTGFWKSVSFGIIVTWVCTYKGFHVAHGAEGVARATTQAVVLSSVLILVWDYFLGTILP